ncbi:MAG: glycosyltransferase family 4 protein [Candidatus Sumerlaeaceae bacterium]
MRIIIDARYLKADYSGIGTYSAELLQALGRHDHSNEYIVLVHSSYHGDLELPDNFEIIQEGARPVSLRTVSTLGHSIKQLNGDVLHSLLPIAPLTWRKPLTITVFDLQPLLDPQFTARRSLLKKLIYDAFYRFIYPASLRRADYILCISHATKNDLLHLFPDCADKVLVVPAGIAEESFQLPPEEQIERVREKYALPQRYLLYLGSTRPNKNLLRMVDAFEEFLKHNPGHDDLHFVMILKPDRFFDPLFAEIRQRGLLRRIQIHEQVNEAEKRVFMKEAWMLYFATKYEGFGLPVLEAQALGVPVLVSRHSALPEVAGKHAIYCNPDETDSIVEALEQAHNDPELRKSLIEHGPANARRFSWEHAAKEILDMYNHLLS